MKDIGTINNLLAQIQILSKKIKEQQKEKKKRGELFNIFNDLNLTSDEVRLHSSILSSLLNPKGSHGQGDKYLKAFIEMLYHISPSKVCLDFISTSSSKVSVQVEKYIGPLTETEGGRLDLYITDTNHRIIIENKIYAGDQPNQLLRYWNYGIYKGKKSRHGEESFLLIYLTLDGHEPDKKSISGLTRDNYICISYKYEIRTWLERCLELSARQPLIRETIVQYINTINFLTDLPMETNNELIEILSKTENIDTIFEISKNLDNVINNIINKEFLPNLRELSERMGFKLIYEDNNDWVNSGFHGPRFINEEWKYFNAGFDFDKKGLNNVGFGLVLKDNHKRSEFSKWEELQEIYNAKDRTNQKWIYKDFEGDTRWRNAHAMRNLKNGETLSQFEKMLNDLLELSKEFDF